MQNCFLRQESAFNSSLLARPTQLCRVVGRKKKRRSMRHELKCNRISLVATFKLCVCRKQSPKAMTNKSPTITFMLIAIKHCCTELHILLSMEMETVTGISNWLNPISKFPNLFSTELTKCCRIDIFFYFPGFSLNPTIHRPQLSLPIRELPTRDISILNISSSSSMKTWS